MLCLDLIRWRNWGIYIVYTYLDSIHLSESWVHCPMAFLSNIQSSIFIEKLTPTFPRSYTECLAKLVYLYFWLMNDLFYDFFLSLRMLWSDVCVYVNRFVWIWARLWSIIHVILLFVILRLAFIYGLFLFCIFILFLFLSLADELMKCALYNFLHFSFGLLSILLLLCEFLLYELA